MDSPHFVHKPPKIENQVYCLNSNALSSRLYSSFLEIYYHQSEEDAIFIISTNDDPQCQW